jgi:hypothetical protein
MKLNNQTIGFSYVYFENKKIVNIIITSEIELTFGYLKYIISENK